MKEAESREKSAKADLDIYKTSYLYRGTALMVAQLVDLRTIARRPLLVYEHSVLLQGPKVHKRSS